MLILTRPVCSSSTTITPCAIIVNDVEAAITTAVPVHVTATPDSFTCCCCCFSSPSASLKKSEENKIKITGE